MPGSIQIRWTRRRSTLLVALFTLALISTYLLLYLRTNDSTDPEPVTIALALHPSSAILITALEHGFFAAEGLSVSVTEYPSGARALAEGILAGNADISSTTELPVMLAGFENHDIAVLASVFNADNVNRIIARRSAGITEPQDLRGKRVATQKASAVHFFLSLCLAEHGLSESDVQLSFLKAEDLPTALAERRIDAFAMREPYVSQARAQVGNDAVVFASPGLYPQTELVVADGRLVRERPHVVKRFIRALLKAEAFTVANSQAAIALTARRLGADQAEIAALWPSLKLQIRLEQALLLLLETEARWAIEQELTSATTIPDYRSVLYPGPLRVERPESVTLIE